MTTEETAVSSVSEAQMRASQRRRESFFAVKNSTVIVPRSGHHSYDRLCTSGKEQVSKHVDRHICQKIMSSTEDNVVPSAQQNDLEHDEIEEEDPVFDDHSDDYTRKHEGSASESLRKASESKGDNPAHAIRKRLSRMAMHNYLEAVLSVLELFDRIHVMVRLETANVDTVRFMAVVMRSADISDEQEHAEKFTEKVSLHRSQSMTSNTDREVLSSARRSAKQAEVRRTNSTSHLVDTELCQWPAMLLGIDILAPCETRPRSDSDSEQRVAQTKRPFASIGLVLPICAETVCHLDGDGGFSITYSTARNCRYSGNVWRFKPVSIQATFSALSSLKYCCDAAQQAECSVHDTKNINPLVEPYEKLIADGDPTLVAEWNHCEEAEQTGNTAWQFALMTQKLEKRDHVKEMEKAGDTGTKATMDLSKLPLDEVRTKIYSALLRVMLPLDLEEVSTKQLRDLVETKLGCSLATHRETFEQCVLVVMGQLEKPSRILDGLYLGSEWNASNLDEMRRLNVRCVLNCACECDNFYPTKLQYMNVRVYDTLDADLLRHWGETHTFIDEARRNGAACLVHCKMGVSRSASTVIAYCMKECKWTLSEALQHVKKCRPIAQPNENFMRQLATYEGILAASRRRTQLHDPLIRVCSSSVSLGSEHHCHSRSDSQSSVQSLHP